MSLFEKILNTVLVGAMVVLGALSLFFTWAKVALVIDAAICLVYIAVSFLASIWDWW